MKKAIFTILFALSAILFANAQVYDGITQPTRFRIWVPTTVSLHGSSTSVSPFIGYRQNITSWFNITPVVQYEINSETFVPQVWLNFSICDKLYFLSRSIYNTKANDYRHTLSATYKLPMGFMIDGTWENIYNGRKFLAREPNADLVMLYWDTDMFRSSKQDQKFGLEKGKNYTQMFKETMKKAAANPDDYPGYEIVKKLYAKTSEATSEKTFQKMYQVLVAGDPKKRSYRIICGDIYRDTQIRDGIIKPKK